MISFRKSIKATAILLIVALCATIFSGCVNNSNGIANESSENETVFQPYDLAVQNSELDVYSGPGYSFNAVNKITNKGTYTILEEQTDDYGTVWGRIENPKGWIDIKQARAEQEKLENNSEPKSELEKLVLEGNQRYYTEDDLADKSDYELSILRNGMFALSGKQFVKNQEVKKFFEACDWYSPDTTDDDVVRGRFNDYQIQNLELIQMFEDGYVTDEYEEYTPQDMSESNYDDYTYADDSIQYSQDIQEDYTTDIEEPNATDTSEPTPEPTPKRVPRSKSWKDDEAGIRFCYKSFYFDEESRGVYLDVDNIRFEKGSYGEYYVTIKGQAVNCKSITLSYKAYDKNGNLVEGPHSFLRGSEKFSKTGKIWLNNYETPKIKRVEIFMSNAFSF